MKPASPRPDLDRMAGQALVTVLGSLLGLPAAEVKPVETDATGGFVAGLQGTVNLMGQRASGQIHLRLSRVFAEQGALRLIGAHHPQPPDDEVIQDFAGELCNMLAGHVAAQLRSAGHPCDLGTPEVAQASRPLPELEPGADFGFSRTDWSCQGHRLTLEIRLRYRPT